MRKSCTAFMLALCVSTVALASSQQPRQKTQAQLIAELKAHDKQAEKRRQQEAADVAAEYARDPQAAILSEDFTSNASAALKAIDDIYPGDEEITGRDEAKGKTIPLITKAHSRGELVLWNILQEYMMARLVNTTRVQSIKHSILHPEEDEVAQTAAFKRSQDLIVQQIAARETACHQAINSALSAHRAPISAPICAHATYETRLY